ncbi:hypothetical protein [Bacillus toyonensis]|uniref:hypothetical protein n=1 Tax=Bacillus toyonensis TaxID=155322 RepID=UPI000BEB637F|nr:hypothetical protein [Bacillus toyonensis]PEA33356.1 hypothetical protein COO13_10195 [Bacillus toyonensis]
MDIHFLQKLKDLSKDFDVAFETFESSYTDRGKSNWVLALILSIFKDFTLYRNAKLLTAIAVSIGGIVCSRYLLPFEQYKVWIYAVSIVLCLSVALLIQYNKMIDIKNKKHFHSDAYRFARKSEYDLFYKYAPYNFSFGTVYDQITKNHPAYAELENKLEQIHYKQKIVVELEEKYKSELEYVKKLETEFNEVIYQVNFISRLLKEIITIIYQMNNGSFKESSLRIISGFTIYELSDDKKALKKIVDEGTTGAAKELYDVPQNISDEDNAVIRALNPNKEDRYAPEFDHPYSGRVIISLSMKMDEGKTWVFNFHAETTEDIHIFFLLSDNLISTRETYRLTHALCLILQKKRGDIDVLENRSAAEDRTEKKRYTHA